MNENPLVSLFRRDSLCATQCWVPSFFLSMMHLNIMHRPGSAALYPIFRRQQELVHGMGLKTTVFLSYSDLLNPQTICDMLRDEREYGDELALGLHTLSGSGLSEITHGMEMIWLFTEEQKREILQRVLAKYREVFNRDPLSVGHYHLDASTLRILKELAPGVEAAVAGCFEEGVRVFHGCNHSWYLFNEGMPWNPWYPSRTHALRPAENPQEDAGVVAVPHLVRDMALSYEGRNDFWASHPPNVIRGMGNDASFCPYDLNLIDQYRMQAEWNGGYSYYNTFVGTSWLTWNHNSEYPPEVAWELYTKFLRYLVELKRQGNVEDLTLAEYARWHRKHLPIGGTQTYWAKEMLYGSGKHYFWFIDPAQRVLIDATQGGSIGDLRPYVGKVPVSTGPDTPHRQIGSYPYLIQSQYRTGNAHHHTDGARTTLLLSDGNETIDFCKLRAKIAGVDRAEEATTVTLTPIHFRFASGLEGNLVTRYHFLSGGVTRIERSIMDLSYPAAELTLSEYFKGAPGRTEYPEDLRGIRLAVNGAAPAETDFDYSGTELISLGATSVSAWVPQTNTHVKLCADGETQSGTIRIGHLFSPYFTLILTHQLKGNGTILTCLNLTHINN